MARITAIRERVRRLPGGWMAWRVGVTVIGIAAIAGGIVLLPLPGPGWLIIFAGLGVLGTEYAWAKRLLAWLRAIVRRWAQWIAHQPLAVRILIGLLGLAVIGGIAYAAWTVYE
jgi:uncharacterized protein (TIGR02611 family)